MTKRRRTKKDFDSIEFKRNVQAEIYKEIKGLSPAEEIAYFRRHAESGPFAGLLKHLREREAERLHVTIK